MQPASRHRIVRSDKAEDHLTRQRFNSYDAAYDELERYYGDFCCSTMIVSSTRSFANP